MTQPIFWKNFEARTDLKSFGNNALLLYTFDLRFDIEDINFFASENIVENAIELLQLVIDQSG